MNLAWIHDPLWLVLNTLVAFRLTRLWVADELPPLPTVRQKLDHWADARWSKRTHPPLATQDRWRAIDRLKLAYADENPVKRLWDCYWCAGFWIALGTFLGATLIPAAVWPFIALPLALSAAVGLLGSRD